RQTGEGADRGGMSEEQQVAPYLLDPFGLAADQRRRQRARQQLDDGRATCADRVAVADPGRAIRIGDENERRLLTDEGLDGVDALGLRHEIDHANLDPCNLGHVLPRQSTKYLSCVAIRLAMIVGARSR